MSDAQADTKERAEMSKQAKRNSDFLQPKNIREAAAREMIVPDWAKEVPAVEQQESEPAQVATKVEKLAESLKHNKSSVVTPRGELGYSNIPYRDLGEKSNFCFVLDCRKSLAGGGFGMYATSGYLDEDLYQRYMFHRCSEGASDITGNKLALASSVDKESTSFRPLSIDSSRLSRSALLRWFPVALENTTYSDAIVRHNTSSNGSIKRGYIVYSIANTRHYSNTTMRDKRVLYLGNKAN